jgi:drug/metabolite transporter (DMT)-like permease
MHAIRAILMQIAAVFVFTVMAALIRWLGDRIATGEVVFARSFFALVPLLFMLAHRNELKDAVRTERPFGHFWRSLSGAGSMFLTFAALERLPLVDVTAIGFASPLITVALAAILLGETVRIYRWSAVAVGLAGVLIMLLPQFEDRSASAGQAVGATLALAGSFLTALAMVQVRRLTATESTASIVFYFSVFSSLAGLLTLPFGWVRPSPVDAAVLVAIGILGGIGQILLTQSYRHGDASLVAPFGYSSILSSMLLGYAMFGEVPDAVVIGGGVIVIGAGLFVIWRERQLGLDRTPAKQAETPPSATPS